MAILVDENEVAEVTGTRVFFEDVKELARELVVGVIDNGREARWLSNAVGEEVHELLEEQRGFDLA